MDWIILTCGRILPGFFRVLGSRDFIIFTNKLTGDKCFDGKCLYGTNFVSLDKCQFNRRITECSSLQYLYSFEKQQSALEQTMTAKEHMSNIREQRSPTSPWKRAPQHRKHCFKGKRYIISKENTQQL